jgi:hypothetical protein
MVEEVHRATASAEERLATGLSSSGIVPQVLF